MTLIIFGSSSCIIFAVVRSTFVAFALSFAFFVLSSLACVPTVFWCFLYPAVVHASCFAVVRSTFVAFALSFAFFVLSSLACVPTVFWWFVSYPAVVHASCKLLPKINKYLTVRNVAARFGYFSVFCWVPLCHWDCHKMMWLPAVWCDLSRAQVLLEHTPSCALNYISFSFGIPFPHFGVWECLEYVKKGKSWSFLKDWG